jgi:CBS domain-containing protein
MKIERIYTRQVMATTREASLAEAAAAMASYRVGWLLVVDRGGPEARPMGIITDRDVAIRGFASESGLVGSVMTPVVATVCEDADTHEAVGTMRAHGVRRLLVTGRDGGVRGILSIDDVIDGLSADLAAASCVLKGEIQRDAAGLGEVKLGLEAPAP